MSTAASTMTAADLLAFPDAERFELVDGQLVERPAGFGSSWVGGEVFGRIANYARETQLGWAFPGSVGYQCFREDRERVRRPDASYILRGRLPHGPTGQGHCRTCPDLAVEVVSPGDIYYEIESKVDEYLSAGVKQVWIVSPLTRQVVVYQKGKTPAHFQAEDEFTCGDLLPGFSCPVDALFPPLQQRTGQVDQAF